MKTPRNPFSRGPILCVEKLEDRALMASSISLTSTGILDIRGTAQDDRILIREAGGTISVIDGAAVAAQFASADVNDISFRGYDGNDRFDNRTAITSRAYGYSGADVLYGGFGDDLLIGGLDNDRLLGRDGNDRLIGQDGNDRIYGNDGADVIQGGNDNDTVYAHAGNDTVYGNNGNDRLYGYDGNDRIQGDNGDDIIVGHAGDDTIIGSNGNDRLFGYDGNDRIFGNDGNDLVYGNNNDDLLFGNEGNDFMRGHAGADTMHGDAGDDTIFGENGNDSLRGGAGNDFADGRNGDDYLRDLSGNNELLGGNDNDLIEGGSGDEVLRGGLGDDTLHGAGGNDRLFGDFGDDFLRGEDGDDQLIGGAGKDDLRDGAGYNIYVTNNGIKDGAADFVGVASDTKRDFIFMSLEDSHYGTTSLVYIDDLENGVTSVQIGLFADSSTGLPGSSSGVIIDWSHAEIKFYEYSANYIGVRFDPTDGPIATEPGVLFAQYYGSADLVAGTTNTAPETFLSRNNGPIMRGVEVVGEQLTVSGGADIPVSSGLVSILAETVLS